MYFGSYASVLNQAYHLAHYLLAFLLAYVFIPQLMFKPVEGTRMDNYFANFLRMVLFVIILGYLLIVTKLLEFIGFGASIVTWILLMRGKQKGVSKSLTIVVALFYDLIETPYLIRQALSKLMSRLQISRRGEDRLSDLTRVQGRGRRSAIGVVTAFLSDLIGGLLHRLAGGLARVKRLLTPKLIYPALLTLVLAVSIYLRWTDAVVNAAPPMSDGVVILAWVKYVNLRILFHDGIYPQGYFISDDFINKFAFINPLYVVKYTGAMATTLIVVGMYYVTSRMGRTDQAAGIIAAFVYGIVGYTLLHGEWARQAAMETQEFGFAFALPTLYFAYRYFSSGIKRNLTVTFAGLTVSGLIHVLSYMLTLIGCISVLIAFLILDERKKWGRYGAASLVGVASGLISLAPLELGRLFHRTVNTSAATFAAQTVSAPSQSTSTGPLHLAVPLPSLDTMSKVALVAILLLFVSAIAARARGRRETAWLSGGIFGLLMFLVYYLGGPLTGSVVILDRSVDNWAVAAAFCIGLAVQTLARQTAVRPWLQVLEKVSVMGIVIVPQVLVPPQPIIPYKMEWNADVDQYLKINDTYKTSGYMLVAPSEQYALVLGSGFLMSASDFVKLYDPMRRPLTRYGQKRPDTSVAPNVFIYDYKHIFQLPKSETVAYAYEEPVYHQERIDKAEIEQWLKSYRQHGFPITVYYNGPDLTIYYIHNEVTDSSNPVPATP
ncbi:hypothetical protein [Alicyclobacillus mengziensis]|uniref:Uncharacterized protein n=1 Tax=Alicyclobacillus mengziensis TaxID=2931921 RepID=A0A9X7VYQ9_9BACL|nr:hypothetical protein [Alicyclobacillus mengziensis]QSO47561.1 hypothetical protein JZ786_00370 [Alicyclobacillus mengziensis]